MTYLFASLIALSLLTLAYWLWCERRYRRDVRALDEAKRKEYELLWAAFRATADYDERIRILRRIDRAEWDWLDRHGSLRGMARSRFPQYKKGPTDERK